MHKVLGSIPSTSKSKGEREGEKKGGKEEKGGREKKVKREEEAGRRKGRRKPIISVLEDGPFCPCLTEIRE